MLRVAALAYQLRPQSRTRAKIEPVAAHSPELMMLRFIEHNQRLWHWAHTKDAKDESTAPEPLMLEGEEQAIQEHRELEEKNAADVAAQLGIDL